MLGGSDFVVFCFSRNAQFPQFFVQFCHEGLHPGFDGAEIMVFHLLSFGRLGPEQGAARKDQVLPFFPHGLVYQEILLFRAHVGDDFFCMYAENRQQPSGRFA